MRWPNPQTPSQKYINAMGGWFSSTLDKRLKKRINTFPFSSNELALLDQPNDASIAELLPQLEQAINTGDLARFKTYLGPHTELKYRQYAQRYLERLAEWSTNRVKGAEFYEIVYHTVRLFFQFLEYERIWDKSEKSYPLYQSAKEAYTTKGLKAYFEILDSEAATALKEFLIDQWDEKHSYDENGEGLSTENLSEEERRLLLAILRQELTHPNQSYQPSVLLSQMHNLPSYQGIVVEDEKQAALLEENLSWEERFQKATRTDYTDSLDEWLEEISRIIERAQGNPIIIYAEIEKQQYRYVSQCIQAHDSQKKEAATYQREIRQLKTKYQAETSSFFQHNPQESSTRNDIRTSGIGLKPLDDIAIKDSSSDLVPLMYAVTANYARVLRSHSQPDKLNTYINMGAWLIQHGALLASPRHEQNAFAYAQLPENQIPNSWLGALGNSLSSPTTAIYPLQKLLTREISYKIGWLWFFGLVFRLTHNEQDTNATVIAIMNGQRTLYYIEQPDNEREAQRLIKGGRSIFHLPRPNQPLLIKGTDVEMDERLLSAVDSVI